MSDDEDDDRSVAEDEVVEPTGPEAEFETLNEPTDPSIFCDVVVIAPEHRKTSNMITKTEMTEIISIRADQISNNANVMVPVDGLDNPIAMAKKEFNMRRCPLKLRRVVKKAYDRHRNMQVKYVEDWDVNKMSRPFEWKI